jgi:tetratricopeptide (TPR) repeat protein
MDNVLPLRQGRKDILALALIGLLSFLAYYNSFHGEFQFDDDRLIRFNFALRDISLWKNVLRFEPFRPLTLLTYAVNFQISQKDPFSYHVFSFILHLISTGLFYWFLRRFNANILLCFFSAALFAIHPINTESVSYIASRPVLLCSVFYLAALLCFDAYLRNGGWGRVAAFFLFFLLGLSSKEEAALIPAAALLYNYAIFGKESVKKHAILHGLTILLIACGVIFRIYFELVTSAGSPHPLAVYITTEMHVWMRYVALAIFPIPLNVDHFVEPLNLTHWKFLVSFLTLLLILFFLWKAKKNHRWIFFWGIWFFLNLASTSFVPLNDFMAEHRTYLSMFGFCACIAYLISAGRPGNKLIPFALSCLLVFYVAATWKRNMVWEHQLSLWYDSVQKSPQKFRTHQNLAFILFRLGAYDDAIQEYLIARSLNPHHPRVHAGLGFSYLETGRVDLADTCFREALRIDPAYIDAKTGRGIIFYRQKKFKEALSYFTQVYPERRESPDLVVMMCDSYLQLKRVDEARQILAQASLWEPRFGTVNRLLEVKKPAEAIEKLREISTKKRE